MKSGLELVLLCTLVFSCQGQFHKVLLSSVQTLTLHSGKFTAARRGSPIPQLLCLPTNSPCTTLPSTVQCYNKGMDGLDVQWKCEAQLPRSLQFDHLQVNCEGFDYPNDPYILAGSCGLTYSLKPTGVHSHGHHHKHANHHQHSVHYEVHTMRSSPVVPIVSALLLIVVLVGLVVLAYRICPCHSTESAMLSSDAPPSYYCRTQYKPLADDNYAHCGGSSGPGFWTGAAVGSAAGYMIGSAAVSAPTAAVVETCVISSSDDSCDDEDEVVTTATGYASTWRR